MREGDLWGIPARKATSGRPRVSAALELRLHLKWYTFLWELNDRYYTLQANNPAFVSIAIAGPNGASDEMILPTTAYDASNTPQACWPTWHGCT